MLKCQHMNELLKFHLRCCKMSTLSTLQRYFLFFPRHSATSTFSKLLRNVYSFHTAAPCLLFPSCCAMSAISTLLRKVYFFYTAAPCLLFLRCCAMPTFSTLLHHVYFFHHAAPCLLFHTAAVTFSTLLCKIYVI